MHVYKPASMCAFGVWAVAWACLRELRGHACARACMLGRVQGGQGRLLREEGMGEADVIIAGYSWTLLARACLPASDGVCFVRV
jgi:hypothetical protein